MSEFSGEFLQSVKLEHDEDETVEVKYEPFDSELESKSEILRYDSGCLTCQKFVMKITAHLTGNLCPVVNDGMGESGQPEPVEYIVIPNSLVKNEPDDYFVKSEPWDDDRNDPKEPGTHDSVNRGQKQCKVLDFDTGLCKLGCEFCEKCVQELKNHLKLSHPPQLQCQPTYDSDIIDLVTDSNEPPNEKSTILGPLKTIDCASPEACRFRNFLHLRKPVGEKDEKIKKRTTQTSKRAGYPEEAIAIQLDSCKPVKKKSRLNSDRSDENKNKVIERRTRRPNGENSDTEIKSKESESKGRSANKIQTEVQCSELNPTYETSLGEKVNSSDSHEINLTDHVSHTGGKQEITQTGNDLTEMLKSTIGGVSVKMIHSGREAKMDRSGQKLDQPTPTGEIHAGILLAGKRYVKMSRIADEMSHIQEKTTNMAQIMSGPANTIDTAGELPKLTHTGDKPSMMTRTVEKPARPSVTRSGKKPKSTKVLKPKILKRLKSSESKSNSTTPLDNSYNCKNCRKPLFSKSNLWYHNYVVSSDKRLDCGECEESFMTRNTLTLHEKQKSAHGTSNRICHSQNTEIRSRETRRITRTHGENSERKSERRSLNEIQEKLENVGVLPKMTRSGGKRTIVTQAGDDLGEVARNEREREKGPRMLKRRNRSHTTDRRFKCDVCEKTFNVKSNLNVHNRSHTGDKPFECDMCDKTFGASSNLKTHRRTHTGEKPYACDVCEKTFGRGDALSQHKKTHTIGKKQNKCKTCKKVFARAELLELHKRIHTGVDVFKCDKCEKSYVELRQLALHKLTHTGKKPHKCDECNKGFRLSHDLIRHKKIHSKRESSRKNRAGDNPYDYYDCNKCDKTFNSQRTLKIHYDKTHT